VSLTIEDRIPGIAAQVASRYPRFVDRDDVEQELRVYALGEGKKHLDRYVADGDEFRVQRALFGAAKQYAEREKAQKSGYSFEDVAWYSPSKLAELVPLALNPKWDGLTGQGDESAAYGSTDGREGGTLLAMVADVRRALAPTGTAWTVSDFDPETETGLRNLEWLADQLGGEYPEAPGYGRGRRAISNAAARALTENGYTA
jgi:hypothetical protein